MDEFEKFFSTGGAAQTAPEKPASEFDDFFEFERQRKEQTAREAVSGAMGAKPDEVGKAMTLGPQVGLPAQAVETDIPSFDEQVKLRNASTYVERNPVLQSWLAGDVDRARVAIDDFENLDMISQTFRAISSGWSDAFVLNERARAQVEQSALGVDRQKALDAYDKRLASNPQLAGLYGWLQMGSGFAGGMLDSAVRAIDEAALGAATGAAMGAAATPEALGAGAVPGFFVGGLVGASQGFFIDQSLIAAGQTYQALEAAVDDNGQGVDPAAKHTAALGVFLAAYGLNYVGGKAVWGSVERAIQAAVVEAAKRPSVGRAMAQFGKELGKAGIEGAAIMGLMEASAVGAQEFAKAYSSDDFATIFNDAQARADAGQRLIEAMTMGAVFMPLAKLPFEAKPLYHNLLRARQAQADAKLIEALGQGVQASKVRTRNLDAFQALINESVKDGSPVDEVGVPVEAVVELYQSLKIAPGADDGVLGKVAPDIAVQIEQAAATGGDIKLNLAAYTAHLGGSDVWNALAADLRLRPEGMTMREAEVYAKGRGQLLEDNAVDFANAKKDADRAEDARSRVFDDMFSKLRRAGYTIDAATPVAALWASRYGARAERLGGESDAFSLYENENVIVRREMPPTVKRVPIDKTDMMIEAIRRGEPVPSDRRIYGPSIVEYIKKNGGMFEERGELKARDLHKMRGFVRSAKKGGDKETYSADSWARALWEAGYFPEFQDRPTINDLLDAIDEELKEGRKRYQYGTDREAEALFKKAFEELDDYLAQNDIDVKKTSNAKIKKFLAKNDPNIARSRELEQGEVDTSSKNFAKWFKKSFVTGFDGKPIVVYHGTTMDFDAFDLKRASKESDLGAGVYFSSEPDDVGNNYAGIGPDLTGKIARRAEQLTDEMLESPIKGRPWDRGDLGRNEAWNLAYEEAKKQATAEMTEHEGATIPVYLSIQKPVVMGDGRHSETFFDVKVGRTKIGGAIGKITAAIEKLLADGQEEFNDVDAQELIGAIVERATDYDGIGAADLVALIKEKAPYVSDPETGDMVSGELVRRIFETAGFDGIIDQTVSDKFGERQARGGMTVGMKGINPDTTHYIIFKPTQAKSIFNSGKWGTQDNRLLFQRGKMGETKTKTILEAIGADETADAALARITAKYPTAKLIPSQGVEPGGVQYVRAKVAIEDLPKAERPGAYREFNQSAYHGSPHIFDKFTLDHIGKGEGAQAYGWGLYFAGDKAVAKFYREKLTEAREVNTFSIGSIKMFDRGAAVDYSPKGTDGRAIAKASLQEALLSEEGALRKLYEGEANEKMGLREVKTEVMRIVAGMMKDPGASDEAKAYYTRVYNGMHNGDMPVSFSLAEKQGRLYKVELAPTPEEMLDWDAKLDKQPKAVKQLAYELAAAQGHAKSAAGWRAWKMEAAGMAEADGEFLYRKLSEREWSKANPDTVSLDNKQADDRAASLHLLSKGVRGIRYLDGNSRGKGKGTRNFVIFDDADITIQEYEQQRGPKDVRRGSIRLEDGASIITLFKDSDLSTILHETGHQWLEEFRRDYLEIMERVPDAAGEMGGGEQLKADFETIMKWLGMKSPGEITVDQHEKFARGFEAYLMEGKAPTAGLARAFRAFRQWLVRIYRDIVGLDAPMSDDVRRVFDRLIATEDEIAAAQDALGANPAFASAKDAGMTDAEFAAYTRKLDAAQKDVDEKVLMKTLAGIRAQREKEWKAQYKEMRDVVREEITSRSDLRADHWLRTGKMFDGSKPEGIEHARLDQKALAAMYGHKGMLEMLPPGVTTPKDGMHPDEAATLFGFRTGDQLVQALMTLEGQRRAEAALSDKNMGGDRYVNHLIDREAHERMLDRHGDALNDGSIEQEAIDALHVQARLEVLGVELKAIAKKAGRQPVSIDDIAAWVDGQLAEMPVHRARSDTGFVRAEGAAGKEVQRALLAGDVRKAFVYKQRQIVNALFAKKSKEAAKEYEAAMKMFTRYAKKAVHKNLEPAFVDQMHAMLKRIGFSIARQDAELAAGLDGATLREFVDGKRADGFDLIAAEYLLDPLWEKPLADMTMGEVRDVADFFRSMIHAGRFEQQMKLHGKLEEFKALKEKALEVLAARDQRPDPAVKGGRAIRSPDVGVGGVKDKLRAGLFRFKTGLDKLDSNLRKIEELCDILDGDDSNGVFNSVIFRPIADAEHREADMRRTITAKWLALRDGMSKEWKRSLDGARVSVPELRKKTGEAWDFTKSELLMIALNMGARSNRDKLLKGEFWDEASVQSALDRLLTEEDWRFVQGTWDIVNSLWPEIDAMERRLSGVGPDKVEAIPVVTPHGTLKGGYFPIMYDANQSLDSRMKVASSDAHLYDSDYQRATTPKGHTKRRVEGYAREIDISGFARIANHLENVIHDLSFREVLMQTQRFIKDKEIRDGIVGVIGKENYMQLFPWLKHIANETAIDQRGLGYFDWFIKRVRLNATMVGLGFRASTVLQQFAGFGDSAEMIRAKGVADGFRKAYGFASPLEALSKGIRLVSQTKAGKAIGAKWMAEGFDAITGSQRKFENARNFVIERSGEVRNRFETIDRDMRQGMKELLGKTGFINEVRRFAYFGIALADQAVVVPTWIGAYRKAISEGKAETDAIYYADKVVRLAQGSGAPKDLAAVARSHNKWFDLITMFYSYFSHFQNRLMRIGGKVKSGTKKIKAGDWKNGRKDYAEAMARFFWLAVVPPMAANLITGRGPEEDEDVASWALRKITFNLFGGVPIARDFASVAERQISGQEADYKFTPAERAGSTVVLLAKDAWNASFGEEPVSDKWLKHAIETAGYVGGLPGSGQLATSSQYLAELNAGEHDPETAAQFMGELLLGPKPKEK